MKKTLPVYLMTSVNYEKGPGIFATFKDAIQSFGVMILFSIGIVTTGALGWHLLNRILDFWR